MAKTEAKASTKKSRAKATAVGSLLRGYIAIHSTDLKVSLAVGMLRMCTDESQQTAIGEVATRSDFEVYERQVPADALERVRSSQQYGQVVVVEVDLAAAAAISMPGLDGSLPLLLPSPLPLAVVRRALFRNAAEKQDFLARASGYDDVPADVLSVAVDESVFGSSTQPLLQELLSTEESSSAKSNARPDAQSIDKLAGSIAAALSIANVNSPAGNYIDAIANACLHGYEEPAGEGFLTSLAAELDVTEADVASGSKLALAAVRLLKQHNIQSGIDPESFLLRLRQVQEDGGEGDSGITRFASRAQEVLSGRLDLANDAFADASGKIVGRALLLFLLNPDAVRLAKVSGRIDPLGPRVHLMSLALAGWYAGLGGLDKSTKYQSRDAFLAIGLLAWRLAWKKAPVLERKTNWVGGGTRKELIVVGGHQLALSMVPPPAELLQLQSLVTSLGNKPIFNVQDGSLEWEYPGFSFTKISARYGLTPTFPRQAAVDLFVVLGEGIPAKDQTKIVQETSKNVRQSGLFIAQVSRGKTKAIELSVSCCSNELDASSLSGAIQVLVQGCSNIQQSVKEKAQKPRKVEDTRGLFAEPDNT